MSAIANLTVNMSLATAALSSGAKKAGGILSGLGSSIANIGGQFAMMGAAAGAAAVSGLTALGIAGMEQIDHMSDLADKTGISVSALSNLEFASKGAGLNIDQVSAGINKMSINLTKLGGIKNDPFAKLGLDAEKLKLMKPEEAFAAISDEINKLPTHSDRAAAAVQIFGKAGADLLPVLAQGSEGLAAMAEENRKLGGEISENGAASVAQLDAALNSLTQVAIGLGRQLATQLAPFVTALIESFKSWALEGLDMGEVVSSSLEFVATGIGWVADGWQVMQAGFKVCQAIVSKGLSLIFDGIKWVLKGLEWVSEALTGTKADFSSTMEAIAKDLDDLAGEQMNDAAKIWSAPDASKGVKKFFDNVRANANKAKEAVAEVPKAAAGIEEAMSDGDKAGLKMLDDLKKQVETFGKSSNEIKRWEIAQSDMSDVLKEQALGMLDQLDALQQDKKDRENSDAARNKTPENNPVKFAGAMDAFGSEARSLLLQNRFGSRGGDDALTTQKDSLAEQKKHTKFLADLAKAKSDIQPFVFAG